MGYNKNKYNAQYFLGGGHKALTKELASWLVLTASMPL